MVFCDSSPGTQANSWARATSAVAARAPRSIIRCCLLFLLLLPLGVLAQTNAFRFVLLSDTHVGSATGEDDLRATVQDINAMPDVSFVLLSGDVTEFGSLEQLRLAKKILDGLKPPLHVVPGNHDTKWSESGATDFARLWPDDRFCFESNGICFIGMHEGPLMKMGDGDWAPQDVRWLARTLANLSDKTEPIIFVTHYPVNDSISNWYLVLDLLKQYNIQAVLCGHGHANRAMNFEGVPGVMGRSNLRAIAPVGGYNLVEIKDGVMTVSERTPAWRTKAPWDSVVLEKHDFAADTNKYPRPDFSINARYPQVKEKWVYDTGYTIASSPAVWKKTVIVGDASGKVNALLLKDGRPLWTFNTQGPVYSTPEVSGGLVFFASADGNIYALKASDGTEVWRVKMTRPIVASPTVAHGTLFIGSSEGFFRAFDAATGKPRWQFEGLGGFVETKPLVRDGLVIFGAWDEHLYALDAKTGRLVWKWQGDKPGRMYSPAACWPIAAHGKVFIAAPDRKMTALDEKTGEPIWRTGQYVVRESTGLSVDQTRFYARAMSNFIYAFSTSSAQPVKLWETNAGFGYDINSAMLVEKDGTLFCGTKNSLLFALDAKTGVIKWEHKLGTDVLNTVVPLSANKVLATGFDGKVRLVVAGPSGKLAL